MDPVQMEFLVTSIIDEKDKAFITPIGSPLATASLLSNPSSSASSRKKKNPFKYNGPRDSLNSRYKIGKPGSRRYRQWENEFFLVQNLSETESEYESEYSDGWDEAYEPSYGSFALVLEEENKYLWEPFIDVTEEQQKILLDFYEQDSESDRDSEELLEPLSPQEAFSRTRHCTRKTLRKHKDSRFLQELDETIFSFSKNDSFELPEGRDYLQQDDESGELIFSLSHKFHRLLLHSLCEYYDLVSYSVDASEERQTIVYKRENTLSRQQSVTRFLKLLEDETA